MDVWEPYAISAKTVSQNRTWFHPPRIVGAVLKLWKRPATS